MIALVVTNKSTLCRRFHTNGWETVRNLANLVFIFVLLYIAIGTILQLNSFDTKNAFYAHYCRAFINFSLFATRIVIDSSNMLAELFTRVLRGPPPVA